MLASMTLGASGPPYFLSDLRLLLHENVIYRMHKYEVRSKCAMHEEKMQYDAQNRSELIILTHKCYFTKLPLTVLFIYKLTMS
jgi:hypothetical protein